MRCAYLLFWMPAGRLSWTQHILRISLRILLLLGMVSEPGISLKRFLECKWFTASLNSLGWKKVLVFIAKYENSGCNRYFLHTGTMCHSVDVWHWFPVFNKVHGFEQPWVGDHPSRRRCSLLGRSSNQTALVTSNIDIWCTTEPCFWLECFCGLVD